MNEPDISAAPAPASPDPETAAEAHDAPASISASMDDASPQDGAPEPPAVPDPIPHAGARYALLRLLMLVAVAGILYVIGMRGWLLAFAAVLVSGIVSLFLFMKPRNDAAVNLEHQVDGWRHRHDHGDAGLAQE
jgi:hypothetical protein